MGKTFFIRTYGCQMNFAESERLRRLLEKSGWREAVTIDKTDALIVVTCSIRQKAENRATSFLESNKHLKEKGTIFCLTGCTANLHKEKILKNLPFLDVVCGPNHLFKIPEILDNYMPGKIIIETGETDSPFIQCIPSKRDITMMVPVTKGCNNFCSYCVVPLARGRLQSKKPDAIIKEISCAVSKGIRSVILLGQNVNEYGNDFHTVYDFADLLKDILKIEGIIRIGFVTSHPEDTKIKLLRVMAENSKITRHLHMPVQSGSNRILRAMNRKYTIEKFLQVVEEARKIMPEVSITSDIMVGFPGETEKDFEETLLAVKKIRFTELFVFKYSARPMTKAATFTDTVSKEEKERRHRVILDTQKQITDEIMASFTGKTIDVFVEKRSVKNPGQLLGRSIQGIPVSFESLKNLIGTIVKLKITGHKEGILSGKENEECLLQQD